MTNFYSEPNNAAHNYPSYFFMIHFNITLPSLKYLYNFSIVHMFTSHTDNVGRQMPSSSGATSSV